MTDTIWTAVHASRDWLDAANGTGEQELTCRMLKVTEEAGEAAGAWIGVLGQNPRKGVTHTRADVVAELADVAWTALVAIESLGFDARRALAECGDKVLGRRTPVSAPAPGAASAGPPMPTGRARPPAAAAVPPGGSSGATSG